MKALALAGAVFTLVIFAGPQQASAATVTARIGKKCTPQTATLVVPRGKKAVSFKLHQLRNGVKCGRAGRPESKGWGISKNGGKVYYWSKWRNKKPSELGGPLKNLQLAPGSYQVFVDGGRGALARISYSLR
ncbi:MAG: hypothetical protein JRH20_20695 [Deltaproteobacteria bacterium]|nr:hypothetical protein [Deltaproteobacteria bacterium]